MLPFGAATCTSNPGTRGASPPKGRCPAQARRSAAEHSPASVTHKGPILNVTRTIATDNGEITSETVYSTDGKETTNKMLNGNVMKNTTKWTVLPC